MASLEGIEESIHIIQTPKKEHRSRMTEGIHKSESHLAWGFQEKINGKETN